MHIAYLQLEMLTAQHLFHHFQLREMELKLSCIGYYAARAGGSGANYMRLVHQPLFSYTVNCNAVSALEVIRSFVTKLLTYSKITKVNYFLNGEIIIAPVYSSETM